MAGPARLAALRKILLRNQDLLRNAGSLAATTGLTSVLGFGYWIYAARVFTPAAVGYGSAAISAMTLLGTIGMLGLGTMLIGELPRRKARGELMTASLIAAFLGSLVLGLGFALVSLSFGRHFAEVSGTPARMALFALGVGVTGATMVFDDATIGLMRGGLQLSRNVALSLAKMAVLPVCGLVVHDVFGVGILLSWILGTLVSVVPVIVMIRRSGTALLYRPDWKSFWRLGRVTLAHNWLNLAITTPTRLVPVLTVLVVSPSANAAFYVAAMLVGFLTMIPGHLSTVLFAIASAEPEKIAEKLRFVLRMALAIGVPAGLALGLSAHLVLSVFGSSYASLATGPLWILIVCYLPGLPNTVYIAVCRAAGRVNRAAVFLTGAAAVQMAAVVIGGRLDGLYGLSYGMLAVAVLEALVTTGPVLRAAFGRAPSRAAGSAVTAAQPALASAARAGAAGSAVTAADTALDNTALDNTALDNTGPLERAWQREQEAGIAALIALATTVEAARGRSRPAGMPAGYPTRPQPALSGARAGRHRPVAAGAAVTAANPVLSQAAGRGDTGPAFHARQEAGLAALIAIATHGVRV